MSKKLEKVKNDQSRGAAKALLEEIFNDLYKNRWAVYKINFVRGIFFGFGTVLGGTIIVAVLIWLLSTLAQFIPPLRDFFDAISLLLESRK